MFARLFLLLSMGLVLQVAGADETPPTEMARDRNKLHEAIEKRNDAQKQVVEDRHKLNEDRKSGAGAAQIDADKEKLEADRDAREHAQDGVRHDRKELRKERREHRRERAKEHHGN